MRRGLLWWLCLLLPFFALPFFVLVGTSYGFSFELTPPPAEPHKTFVALLTTLYPATWLAYLWAAVHWRVRWMAWLFSSVWCCTLLMFLCMEFAPHLLQSLPPGLLPLAMLYLPFLGYGDKLVWNGVVQCVMLGFGTFTILYIHKKALATQ